VNRSCKGSVLVEKDGRQIVDCQSCGYSHVLPLYSEKELEDYYENIYAESTPSYLWHEKVFNIKKWKQTGTILDIGCWEGKQLEFFLENGWRCVGTELNKRAAAVAAAKGIEVHQVSIRKLFEQFAGRKWDVINAAYILEHIPDPAGFLTQIKKHMEKDGILIIEVPNEFNSLQLAYITKNGLQPYWIALPDHLNYFNKRGLETLLERTGFSLLHGEVSFPMEMFLLMGDNYLEDRTVGKQSFGKVVAMENILRTYDPGLLSRLYTALYQCGIGRSVILYAQASHPE
jgi:SAM-dependent methyltransferase